MTLNKLSGLAALIPEDYKTPRFPVAIGTSPDGERYKVVLEKGERSIIDDYIKYRDNSDFQRNALIGAIASAVVMASAVAILKNPQGLQKFQQLSKKPKLLDQIAGGLGPMALTLGGLGLMNSDRSAKDLALLAAGGLATYRASRGDTSMVPKAVKIFSLSAPVAAAGLHYAGRHAERMEGRKNLITEISGATRYTAPTKLLALTEGTSIKDIPVVANKLRRGIELSRS